MIRYYVNSNARLIACTADDHGFQGDTFWWKIDRERGLITDEATGEVYTIPQDLVLT